MYAPFLCPPRLFSVSVLMRMAPWSLLVLYFLFLVRIMSLSLFCYTWCGCGEAHLDAEDVAEVQAVGGGAGGAGARGDERVLEEHVLRHVLGRVVDGRATQACGHIDSTKKEGERREGKKNGGFWGATGKCRHAGGGLFG